MTDEPLGKWFDILGDCIEGYKKGAISRDELDILLEALLILRLKIYPN